MKLAEVGNPFSIGFYNFQIFLVDPDHTVEEGMLALQSFWRDLKNVAVDFVDSFGIEILHVVLGKLTGSYREGGHTKEGLNIVGLELQGLQSRVWRSQSPFVDFSIRGAHGIVGGEIFAGRFAVNSELLDADGAAIGVLRTGGGERVFPLREGLNDFRWRKGGRGFGRGYTSNDTRDFVFRRWLERTRSVFLCV